MAMISKSVIDEILMRTDIENLISGYVSLKRAGSVYKGLCPFHSEKSPSFMVYPSTNSFYCFGCGIGGDAVTFIKQMEHLDYPDAIEFLAKRAGITIIRENDAYEPKRNTVNKERIYKMNSDAARFFHKCLFSDTPDAKEALSYFTEKRKLSLSTIKHFGLGYAPNSFDALSRHLISKGYTYEELTVAFLCGKNDRGGYYDAFRNRAMFPIIDVSGNVIAFGGRALDNETKPKYRNTSDTPAFKKSRNLFALNFARHTCKESIILCEGYMDVIALHAAGFTNAVATLGTAITSEQARLMSRYTKKVIICYDSDEPGQMAASKALKILGEVGLEVRVVTVPGSKDPDEYIKTYGNDKFKLVLDGAKMEFEYKMDNLLAKRDINIPQEKIVALGEVEKLVSEVYSEAERDIYIHTVAKKFEVSYESVKNDVKRIISSKVKARKKEQGKNAIETSVGYSDRVNPDFAKEPAIAKNEEIILGLLLLFEEHKKSVFEGELLTEADFFTDFNKRIFEYIKKSYFFCDECPNINEVFSTAEVGRIAKIKNARMALSDNGDAVLNDSINALKSSMQKKLNSDASTFDELETLINRLRKSEV